MNRRTFLTRSGAALIGALPPVGARAEEAARLPFANGERPLVRYPGKRALIQHTARPPQLETPFYIFDEGPLTPNDAFFVRYHLSGVPLSIDPEAFRLEVTGKVDRPLSLSLTELKSIFAPIELTAVLQCSGNSRGFVEPRTPGGQLGNGAMGAARWRGAPLKAVLDRAGIQAGGRQVVFRGLDKPALSETPAFMRALDLDHARDGEVMIAYEMNGEALPWLNGFPIRLVVPGWYGAFWMKHLCEIEVVDHVFDGYWMSRAYRVPANECACTEPGQHAAATTPLTRFKVRSFITNLADGAAIKADSKALVKGIAFDGGYGIAEVLLSPDGGQSWRAARLGPDLGRYAFREWNIEIELPVGAHELKARAINRIGQTQPTAPLWNPSGYARNVVETVRVIAT